MNNTHSIVTLMEVNNFALWARTMMIKRRADSNKSWVLSGIEIGGLSTRLAEDNAFLQVVSICVAG